jgi:hypothetical protein
MPMCKRIVPQQFPIFTGFKSGRKFSEAGKVSSVPQIFQQQQMVNAIYASETILDPIVQNRIS